MSNVNHPAHYGGEDNPYEVIKVLKHWMSPVEFAGFCKGNAFKYNARAADKCYLEDLQKADWYQRCLIDFAKEVGEEAVFPKRYFWNSDGEIFSDDWEVVDESMIPVAIHSNMEPFTRWGVRFLTSHDGDTDIDWFDSRKSAEAFVESLYIPDGDAPDESGDE